MEYNAASWLQSSIGDVHDGQNGVHDVGSTSGGTQTTLDLSEFGIPDLSGPSTSASTPISTSQTFYTFPQYNHFLPNTPGPYNAVQYGTSQWAGSTPQQIPLSSYSTLNGATSTASSSHQPQQQQPQQQQMQQMMIDPALTMNGSNSPPTQFQQPSPFISSQPQPRTQYSYQHYQQQPQQSPPTVNPSFVHTSSSHYQQTIPLPRSGLQHQQQQAPQGTLSPYQLHSPPNSSLMHAMGAVSPVSFYSQTSTPNTVPSSSSSGPSPEQRKATFLSAIKPLLTPSSFSGAAAVEKLVSHIEDYGTPDVEPSMRFEILTKMRDNAGNHYFRAWVENEGAMDITREWLKLAFTNKGDVQLLETIMPLLHIIDRLPFSIETLKSSKLGKIIVKLVKEPPAPAIQDMASNLERKWRQLLENASSKRAGSENAEDPKGKKRKAEVPSAKVAPPAKKVAVAAASSSAPSGKTTVVKKEAKGMVKEVKDAKSDSSFFSAPKPKPKLPSFKKAPPAPAVKKEPDQNVAQPSSINPFEEALKSMKSRKDSPATATPPPAPPQSAPPAPTVTISAKTGRLKKTVTWAPEGKLEMVKLIERAVYDDDPAHGLHGTHNIRDLDRDEGAALHAHLFEEVVEWSEPSAIEMPVDIDARPRGQESQEKQTQEIREQSALIAVYTSPEQIPDSPAEPTSQIPEEQVDENIRIMLTGPEVDAIFWSGGMPAAVEPPKASVAELVGQLAASGAGPDVTMTDATLQGASQPLNFDASSLQGLATLDPGQIQQLLQQVSQASQAGVFASGQPAGPPSQPAAGEQWAAGGQFGEYDRGFQDDTGRERRLSEDGWGDRGRGRFRGRGRGRGDGFRNNKRKPCSFFAAGRCRYGDQCDFSHESVYS
ncbi:hypothetical protein OBBRIDRAFT_798581 [Obba rivulosa]|uniref:Serine/threonine-protein phosphatase 1 regulatory subunit 10 n=1 Tax=Obba rivulosa TaxID=1052685 RepID=A0A8E2ATK6_9APHY|nr:hypothetical protein OBBRIDRAFT_798581 [Obba rivulosa]